MCQFDLIYLLFSFRSPQKPLLVLGTNAGKNSNQINSTQLTQSKMYYKEVNQNDIYGFHDVIRWLCDEIIPNLPNKK